MDEDINMPEASQDQENTQELSDTNPATNDDAVNACADAAAASNTSSTSETTPAVADKDDNEDENTNVSADGAAEMSQETGDSNNSNDDEPDEAAEDDEAPKADLVPEPIIDENTILLPVAGENGFSADDPAMAFNASDFLQEEEDVIDPMAASADRRAEKTISQVPKKRRIPDAVKYEEEEDESPDRNQKRRGRKPGTKVINGQVIYPSDQTMDSIKKNNPRVKLHSVTLATPKSSYFKSNLFKSATKIGKVPSGQVDENQCRVCTTTTDLVSIFKKEYQKAYADKLMAICPMVNIQRKDFLPQFICRVCVSSVNAAFALKSQCEQTDLELRQVLETSIKKVRKVTSYKLLDSDPEDIPDAPQDQDFKLSDVSPPSAEDSDSDYNKPLLKRRGRRSRKHSTPKIKTEKKYKSSGVKKESTLKKTIKPDPDLNDSKTSDHEGDPTAPSGAAGDFSSGSEEDYSPPKKRRGRGRKPGKSSDDKPTVNLTCNVCNETLNSREELREHKKTLHSSFDCELCGRKFKMQSSLKTHMEKHTSLKILNCEPCNMHFPNKTERRRHMQETHKDTVAQFSCEKCKRAFTSETRLQKHAESNCPGFDTSQKKRGDLESLSMGKDLFKCVAPLTTTYWSDSFSD